MLSRVLSEIGVLLGVLQTMLSRVAFLLFCVEDTRKTILESTFGSTPESTPILESTLESTLGALSEISLFSAP